VLFYLYHSKFIDSKEPYIDNWFIHQWKINFHIFPFFSQCFLFLFSIPNIPKRSCWRISYFEILTRVVNLNPSERISVAIASSEAPKIGIFPHEDRDGGKNSLACSSSQGSGTNHLSPRILRIRPYILYLSNLVGYLPITNGFEIFFAMNFYMIMYTLLTL
jgi:hypothetical protein